MKIPAVLVLCLTCALCLTSLRSAGTSPPPVTAGQTPDSAAAQRYLQVTVFNSAGGLRYTLADAEIMVEIPDPAAADQADPFVGAKQHRVTLQPATATAAWEAIVKLDILHWRAGYDASDLGQEDAGGTEWTVEARFGKEKKQTRGANAFPSLSPIGMIQIGAGGAGPDAGSAFSKLVSILKSLAAS